MEYILVATKNDRDWTYCCVSLGKAKKNLIKLIRAELSSTWPLGRRNIQCIECGFENEHFGNFGDK